MEAQAEATLTQETPYSGRSREIDVGITEYLGQHKGFIGIIKQRYSDFLVNEIDLEGNIVRLTSVDLPVTVDAANGKQEIPESCVDVWDKLKQMASGVPDISVEIDVTTMSKEDRRLIHGCVKKNFSTLYTTTEDKEEGKKILVVYNKTNGSSAPERGRGGYVHFTLCKNNMDTMEAINLISSKLRMKANSFTYAGTKDRRARTSQRVSVPRVECKRIKDICQGFMRITVGNFEYKTTPIQLGDLKGNHFNIVLRNVTTSDECIKTAMTAIVSNGFINYFGLQRFGSTSIPTHHIGIALLKGQWEKAVELILMPRPGDNSDLSAARESWWKNRDAATALKKISYPEKTIEGKLLIGLNKHGATNYVNALESIPKNTRLMYIHAYQSYIWNVAVSKRLQTFGMKVVKGDLMLKEEIDEQKGPDRPVPKTLLDEVEISECSILDIVLPMPGSDIIYPQNEMKDVYTELLALDELDKDDGFKQKVRTYSLGGTYRKLIIKPTNVSWHNVMYNDPQAQLVLADVDIVSGLMANMKSDGKYKALVVQFSLPSSTYATMALREVMKMDTSSSFQSSLNEYCNKRTADDVHDVQPKKLKSEQNVQDSIESG